MKKWNIGWGPISICNMNCEFCYSRFKREHVNDLNYEDWLMFINNNHDWINSINFGTGENSLSNDWFKLIDYIRKYYPEIRQAVTTNGYLSHAIKKRENMDSFIHGIDEVDVSLDFYDKEKHNKFRGQSKAFDWAIDTLKLCQKYSKVTTIVFLGSSKNLNKDNIDGLFSIAKKYNAILRMNLYRPTEGINEFSEQFIASPDLVVDTLKYISEKYSIIALNDTLFSSILTSETVDDPSGMNSIRVLSDGGITPSTYLIDNQYIIGNIKEVGILGKMSERYKDDSIIKNIVPKECEGCIYEKRCSGGVIDRRFLWYGSLEQKDPYCSKCFKQQPKSTIQIEKFKFSSVHDGYLPTIFFRNKERSFHDEI